MIIIFITMDSSIDYEVLTGKVEFAAQVSVPTLHHMHHTMTQRKYSTTRPLYINTTEVPS